MTSEIAAPAAGAVDGADGLLADGGTAVPDDVPVEVCVWPDSLLPAWEQPATSPGTRKDTAISAAIRIPPG